MHKLWHAAGSAMKHQKPPKLTKQAIEQLVEAGWTHLGALVPEALRSVRFREFCARCYLEDEAQWVQSLNPDALDWREVTG